MSLFFIFFLSPPPSPLPIFALGQTLGLSLSLPSGLGFYSLCLLEFLASTASCFPTFNTPFLPSYLSLSIYLSLGVGGAFGQSLCVYVFLITPLPRGSLTLWRLIGGTAGLDRLISHLTLRLVITQERKKERERLIETHTHTHRGERERVVTYRDKCVFLMGVVFWDSSESECQTSAERTDAHFLLRGLISCFILGGDGGGIL